MPITPALSGAKMARNQGVTRDFLAPNVASTSKIQQIDSDRFLGRNITAGNGNTQQVQPWYDVQVPDWTTGAHITNWSTLQYYLSSVAQTNNLIPVSSAFMEVFATNAYPSFGAQDWEGGCLAPNGKIYCFPEDATVALLIDPVTNTVTTFGGGSFTASVSPNNKYQGCVLAPNGKIYGIPCGGGIPQTVFQLIDPTNNTITAYASLASLPSSNAFQGGVLAPNGKIYLAPSSNSVFCLIDPSNNTVSTFATYAAAATFNYALPALGPNGKIYFFPFNATFIRIVDPDNNTVTTIGPSFAGQLIGYGAHVAPNGKIYVTPSHSIGYILDPFNNNSIKTYSCAPAITGAISPFGGRLAPNGKIYFASWVGTFFGVLDPETETVTQLGTVTNSGYLNMVLAPNGKLVLIPAAATSITAYNLNLNNNFNLNICTNPFFNKN